MAKIVAPDEVLSLPLVCLKRIATPILILLVNVFSAEAVELSHFIFAVAVDPIFFTKKVDQPKSKVSPK